MPDPLELNGLDGSNPLGFLAALGTLALCERLNLKPRMHWVEYANSYRPRLAATGIADASELAESLIGVVQDDWSKADPPFMYNDIIACERGDFRRLLIRLAEDGTAPAILALLAGFGSDACVQMAGKQKGLIEPSMLSFANRQSERKLLEDYAALVTGKETKSKAYPPADAEVLRRALADIWRFEDDHKELRWGPNELRQGAYSRSSNTTHGGNLLAFWSLAMLPSFPTTDGIITAGFARFDNRNAFTWPIWVDPLSPAAVRSLMLTQPLYEAAPDPANSLARGVLQSRRSFRISPDKGLYFTESVAV